MIKNAGDYDAFAFLRAKDAKPLFKLNVFNEFSGPCKSCKRFQITLAKGLNHGFHMLAIRTKSHKDKPRPGNYGKDFWYGNQ